MIAIISLLIIISLSVLITRIGAAALIQTGLSKDTARFQARSAFTGTGFTTSESEQVVNHPVRRKILMIVIFLGSAGVISTSVKGTSGDKRHSEAVLEQEKKWKVENNEINQ